MTRGECGRARTDGRCKEARRRRTGVKVALVGGPPDVKVLHATDMKNDDETKGQRDDGSELGVEL